MLSAIESTVRRILKFSILVFGSLLLYKFIIVLGYDTSSTTTNAIIYGFSAITLEEITSNFRILGMLFSVVAIIIGLLGLENQDVQRLLKRSHAMIIPYF